MEVKEEDDDEGDEICWIWALIIGSIEGITQNPSKSLTKLALNSL